MYKYKAVVRYSDNKWFLCVDNREFIMTFDELPEDVKVKLVMLSNMPIGTVFENVGMRHSEKIFIIL